MKTNVYDGGFLLALALNGVVVALGVP